MGGGGGVVEEEPDCTLPSLAFSFERGLGMRIPEAAAAAAMV